MSDIPADKKTGRIVKAQLNIDQDDLITVTQDPEINNNDKDTHTTEVLAGSLTEVMPEPLTEVLPEPLPVTTKNETAEKATIPQKAPERQNYKGGRTAIIRQQRAVPANNEVRQNATIGQQQRRVPPYNKGGQNATKQQTHVPLPLNKEMRPNATLHGQDEKTKYYTPKRESNGAQKQQQQQPRMPLNMGMRQNANLHRQDEKRKCSKRESTGAPKHQQQRRVPLNKLIGQKTTLQGQDEKPKYYIPKREPTDATKEQQEPRIKEETDEGQQGTTHIVWSDTESEEDETKDDKSKEDEIEKSSHDETGMSEDSSSRKRNKQRFRPKLYDFLLDDYDNLRDILIENERKFDDNVIIRCPEFAILLDHVIAMVWYFYRDWRTWHYFDVSQLEWTIKFVNGILSRQLFPHVEIMKQHLEELLIIKYAEVSDYFVSMPEPKPPQDCQCTPEIPFSLQAILQPAPDFQQHLSIEVEQVVCSRIASQTSELTEYANARIQLMKRELAKLLALRGDDDANFTAHTDRTEIIKNIMIHAEEVLRVRELQKV